PGQYPGQLGCRTRQRKVQLNSRTEAEIMPLCQYCDKPQITTRLSIGQQFDLLERSGSWDGPRPCRERGQGMTKSPNVQVPRSLEEILRPESCALVVYRPGMEKMSCTCRFRGFWFDVTVEPGLVPRLRTRKPKRGNDHALHGDSQ